jgi:amino acid adenylation domain-containing protein
VSGTFEYDRGLFDAGDMIALSERFLTLLEAALETPDIALDRLEWLPRSQRALAAQAAAGEIAPRDAAESLHQIVLAQALRTPEAIAIEAHDGSLTYAALRAGALRVAAKLLAADVGAKDEENVIALKLGRIRDLAPVLLGIGCAGAAFLPIDAAAPPERQRRMFEVAKPRLMIVAEALDAPPGVRTILLDDLMGGPDGQLATAKPAAPAQLAYVLFTSGSTGTPKAVGGLHAAIVNRIRWMDAYRPIGVADRVLHKTPLTFDVALWELFWPLSVGATVVMAAPESHGDPRLLHEVIEERNITVAHFVPSMLGAFLATFPHDACRCLKDVIVSGEALNASLARDAKAKLHARLHNLYGPTEAAIDVLCEPVGRAPADPVPIGRPIANVTVDIRDTALRQLPAGVVGEICIGGIALARGYLGDPCLTAERFVPDPVAAQPGQRVYRTGDIGRRLADGRLCFLGRRDEQVKIRGQRIEPGEVSAALELCPGVQRARVLAVNGRDGTALEAFIVEREAGATDEHDLRRALRQQLPSAAIPRAFHIVSEIPRTLHGKLDRRALLAAAKPRAETPKVAPRTDIEVEVADLWKDLLGPREFGIYDDFFAAGGHSLMLAQLAARIEQRFGLRLTIARLFDNPTIDGIVEALAIIALDVSGDADERARLIRDVTSPPNYVPQSQFGGV